MVEVLLLVAVILFEMFHHAFVSRLYMTIRDDLYHGNVKLRRMTIIYRVFYTATLTWVGSMLANPAHAFTIVVGVRAVCVGYQLLHYRKIWFRSWVTAAYGFSLLVALMFSASIAGAIAVRNPLFLIGALPVIPVRIWLRKIDLKTHFQINRDKYDVDLETARRYVRRHDEKMERRCGPYLTKAAERFGINREVIKREILMESMVRQSFSFCFFEFFMKLLPENFPYPQGSTLGMAQASARLAKKALGVDKLSLRALLGPEAQVMGCACLQAEASEEYDKNPQLADSKLLYIVCRYTGTGVQAKHIWNTGVFVEILQEGEAKSKNASERT